MFENSVPASAKVTFITEMEKSSLKKAGDQMMADGQETIQICSVHIHPSTTVDPHHNLPSSSFCAPLVTWDAASHRAVTIQSHHLQLARVANRFAVQDTVPGGKHLADLHKGLVPGLRDDEEDVDSHQCTDRREEQIAESPHRHLSMRKPGFLLVKPHFFSPWHF